MVILENKSPKVITLAVGESLEFKPTFVYDTDYDDTTSATSVMYESKNPNLVSVGEFGYIIANEVGETEINYIVDNPAFGDGVIYIYDLKVNVIERAKDEEENFNGEDIEENTQEVEESNIPELPPVDPDLGKREERRKEIPCPCLPERAQRTIDLLTKVNTTLHALMTSGLIEERAGRLTDYSVSQQLIAYDAIAELLSDTTRIDIRFVERELNNFCFRSEEHRTKLAKVLEYNSSWDKYYTRFINRYTSKQRDAFRKWLEAIVTSTFRI